jgi:hypothetical protein
MNKGRKRQIFTISIYCAKCSTFLYKYQKEGPGSLVKCYLDRIVEDNTKGDLKCPGCGQKFARPAIIHTRLAHKIIQGKIFIRGHFKK